MHTQCLTANAKLEANAVYPGTTMTEDLIADTFMRKDWFATTPMLRNCSDLT
jgi:hypothetical protein